MSAKYALINLLFLAPLLMLTVLCWRQLDTKRTLKTLAVLCLLTLVFDNLMIAAGVMAYNPAEISGIKLGLAPIEDFAYTLAAVLLVALFWKRERT